MTKHRAGKAANVDPRVTILRAAKTSANYKYGMGGLPKAGKRRPKPITLARLESVERTSAEHVPAKEG